MMLKRCLCCCCCYECHTKDTSDATPPPPQRSTTPHNPRPMPIPADDVRLPSTDHVLVHTLMSSCRCHEALVDRKKETSSFLGCWLHNGIKSEELVSFLSENEMNLRKSGVLQEIECTMLNRNLECENVWSEFQRSKQCTAFRRQLPSGLYEYRVHASFDDLSASQLFRTNTDVEYRKTWDSYVVDLRLVDSDAETSTELVHWITRCPYPFGTREYIYLRRHSIDIESKEIVLFQKATDETDIPGNPKITRVDTYLSKVIIKSHEGRELEENGCDYLITYFDDPKMVVPSRIMDLAASRGITDSVKRMHKAAVSLKAYDDG